VILGMNVISPTCYQLIFVFQQYNCLDVWLWVVNHYIIHVLEQCFVTTNLDIQPWREASYVTNLATLKIWGIQ
jgi:hypothetical protein